MKNILHFLEIDGRLLCILLSTEKLLVIPGKIYKPVLAKFIGKFNLDAEEKSIITSYCARIYGNRRSKRKTEKLIKELEKDNTEKEVIKENDTSTSNNSKEE